jgi:membrane protease YdiL (CAAX protease family)
LLVVLIPAFAEELAWRGFAVPRLLPFLPPLAVALVLAVPWTVLHVVLALFDYSVILTWIVVGTGGSVLLTGLVHAGLNGVVPLFRGLDTDQAWLLRGIVAAGIAVLGILVAGMWRRRQMAPAEPSR